MIVAAIHFSLCINPLLEKLKQSGVACCHINNAYIGALSYADYITVLSTSIPGFHYMLEV